MTVPPPARLIRELSLAVPTASARLAHRHLYRTHYLLAKSKPVNPCATVGSQGGATERGFRGLTRTPCASSLNPRGPLLTHLHTVCMAYSERLPTRLNPLAERTCFSQVGTCRSSAQMAACPRPPGAVKRP
jgi:hypothetical protein